MIAWWRKRREYLDNHNQSWAGYDSVGPDGRTIFQNEVLSSLRAGGAVKSVEFIQGKTEGYYRGHLFNSDVEFFIYEDGAELRDIRYERWDYETRQELVKQFLCKARGKEI